MSPWLFALAGVVALAAAAAIVVMQGPVLFRRAVPVAREAGTSEAVAVSRSTWTSAPSSASTVSAGAVEIPDVVGMRPQDAGVVLTAAGLPHHSEITSGSASGTMLVASQDPLAGTVVATGTPVVLMCEAATGTAKASSRKRPEWVVCIDPGHQAHGDSTPEPIGPGSKEVRPRVSGGSTGVKTAIPEYEIALQLSMNLKKRLEQRGVRVVMVRTTNDVNMGNRERAEKANKAHADLFVRIHGSGSPDSRMSGLSTLYPASNKWTKRISARSKRAAKSVQQYAAMSTGAVNRGVHRRRDLVGFNWAKVPAILVECGFLSNPVEDRLLASPHYQDKVASGIADGIVAYLAKTEPK